MAIDLQIENISKSFGDLVLFSDISFAIEERAKNRTRVERLHSATTYA